MNEKPKLKEVNISNLRTVCIALGPYRNLTTLIASILFLHPYCQVLNHAGKRIFNNENRNFLLHNTRETFGNFITFAIRASIGGLREELGGSITLSHAFDEKYPIGQLYRNRYGETLVKNTIQSLFWKESLRVANHIREHNINLPDHFAKNNKLRFLMPIRNPLDCAVSNLKEKAKLFTRLKDYSVENVLTAILDEFVWFFELKKKYPEKFFSFFEYEFDREMVLRLQHFLGLEHDSQWVEEALQAYQITRTYQHDNSIIEFYKNSIQEKFQKYPSLSQKLMRFLEGE